MVNKKLLGLFGLILMATLVLSGCQSRYTQEEVDAMVQSNVEPLKSDVNSLTTAYNGATEQINTLKIELDARPTTESINELQAQIDALSSTVTSKDSEITELKAEISATEVAKEEEKVEGQRLVISEILLGTFINEVISDRDLDKLFDGELVYDGEDYDAEETLTLSGIKTENVGTDFNGKTYLTIPVNGMVYKYVIEPGFDTSIIGDDDHEDETLTFNLLGEEVEVSEWKLDEITFTKGDKYTFEGETDTKTIEDKVVTIKVIHDNYVYVDVDGELKKIEQGTTKKVNGLEIKALDVAANNIGPEIAVLKIGTDVESTVEDGDEYEDDSMWEWVITDNSIGLTLIEEYMYVGEDEDYSALGQNDKLSLPNDFLTIRYDGVTDINRERVNLRAVTKGANNYVEIKGNFVSGIEDYSKLYANISGIYNDDLELITENIEIEGTDSKLIYENGTNDSWLLIGENGFYSFAIDLYVEEIYVFTDIDWVNVCGNEDDVISNYGIIVENPEDACDDNKVTISVPEEQVEAEVSVI